MRLIPLYITAALILSLTPASAAAVASLRRGEDETEVVRVVAAEPDVVVVLCIESGDVVVRGWDRREVRARSVDAANIQLRHADDTVNKERLAKRVEVLVSNSEDDVPQPSDCSGTGNVELDVPRGATVMLEARSGDMEVADVSEARIKTLSGDLDIRRVSKVVEASSISGDVFLKDSGGRVRLLAISGDVEAVNIRTAEASDYFTAKSTSGDVSLEQVAHAHVEAGSTSGDISMAGPLARGGNYDLKTTTGDVTLALPGDASFKINARVISEGEIITDFPVKQPGGAPIVKGAGTRLSGSVGTGDAEINLASFSGTIYLRKK